VLHLLHGWSDCDETTGQLRRRSTGQHHSAIHRPSSAPVSVVCVQHQPPSTRPRSPSSTPLLLCLLPSSTRSSSTPLVPLDYRSTPSRITHLDYLRGLPTRITYSTSTSHRTNSTTADYPRSRTTKLTIITLNATGPHRHINCIM